MNGKTIVSLGGALPEVLEGGAMMSRHQNQGWTREVWRLPTEEELYAVYTYKWVKRIFSTAGFLHSPLTPDELLENYPETGAYRRDDV